MQFKKEGVVMFNTDAISQFVHSHLQNAEKIVYLERELYLVGKETMQALYLYKEQLLQSGDDLLSHHCKLINPTFAAFKYTLSSKHKYTAVFDQEKTKERLEREILISINTIKKRKRKEINQKTDLYNDEEAKKALIELDEQLAIEKSMLEQIRENSEEYEIIFTNFEQYLRYPYVYYRYTDAKGKKHGTSEHLKTDIPNILWFEPADRFGELRNNDKIRKIIETHTRYLDNIYVLKKDNDA
jgi:hypothetical protein